MKSPDQDDIKKLGRTMRYLQFTKNLPLTLEANDLTEANWWVDASFATHHDMKSHTGGVMSMGKGAICASSRRQRINTKSSTEAELVGINDVLPQILWTHYFLVAQGYPVQRPIKVYQDNMSTILLGKNGKASSGQRTRHINIRYFFITDRVAKKEVELVYCPTGDMMADILTKPLQGSLFKKFRDAILNIQQDASRPSTSGMTMMHRSVLLKEPKKPRDKIRVMCVKWKWQFSKVVGGGDVQRIVRKSLYQPQEPCWPQKNMRKTLRRKNSRRRV